MGSRPWSQSEAESSVSQALVFSLPLHGPAFVMSLSQHPKELGCISSDALHVVGACKHFWGDTAKAGLWQW